jgi:hypothetical protein
MRPVQIPHRRRQHQNVAGRLAVFLDEISGARQLEEYDVFDDSLMRYFDRH